MSIPPLVSYITFNRMGLTVRNLTALLKTRDDFDLYIVDSNSKDDTWDYIQSLDDCRIKSKVRFPTNAGPIYAVNYNLARRKPEQYFVAMDSDVHILESGWTGKFMQVFDTFSEVGALGVSRVSPYPRYIPQVILKERNGVKYLQLKNGIVDVPMDFVPGHLQCLRPELINQIGYWSEECYYGDAELSVRVNNYTSYKAGFVLDIPIDQKQELSCEECDGKEWCRLDRINTTCFDIRAQRYKNEPFSSKFHWKYVEFFNELKTGKRTVYCASIHDPESIKNHVYNMAWAQENFSFYVVNSN